MPDRETVEKNKIEFPPGSKKAIEEGCTCDPKANHHGKGYNLHKYMWLLDSGCDLHWFESPTFKDKKRSKK